MKALLGRVLCWLAGHTRGKRVNETDGVATFRCQRCGAYWKRKVKAA